MHISDYPTIKDFEAQYKLMSAIYSFIRQYYPNAHPDDVLLWSRQGVEAVVEKCLGEEAMPLGDGL